MEAATGSWGEVNSDLFWEPTQDRLTGTHTHTHAPPPPSHTHTRTPSHTHAPPHTYTHYAQTPTYQHRGAHDDMSLVLSGVYLTGCFNVMTFWSVPVTGTLAQLQ